MAGPEVGGPSERGRRERGGMNRTPARNRLAKALPEEWRRYLKEHGVPKRKYTAVCKVVLTTGRVIEELIIEEGWIIALDKGGLGGRFEQRIDFDVRTMRSMEIKQVI